MSESRLRIEVAMETGDGREGADIVLKQCGARRPVGVLPRATGVHDDIN